MRVFIIEDEPVSAEALERSLWKLRPDIEIVGRESSVTGSIAFLQSHPSVDVIFADIRIDDGLSFSVFDSVQTDAFVIFVTGYDEYALKAFDYHCVDYLIKPVQPTDLEGALLRVERYQTHLNPADVAQMSSEILHGGVKYRRRILYQVAETQLVRPVEDISYISSDLTGIALHFSDGKQGRIPTALSSLMSELDPAVFVRANRQNVVALDAIREIQSLPGSRDSLLVLSEPYAHEQIKITADKKKEILSLLY